MNAFFRAAAAAFCTFGFLAPARAWDACGHEIVATVAYAHLNPKARAAVDQLAPQMKNPDLTYDAVTIACWMDDIKHNPAMPYHGEFLSWHYIDIPINDPGHLPPFNPGDDNPVHGDIVQALKRVQVVLEGGTDPYLTSPALALAMAEHLLGDLEQPLHCATRVLPAAPGHPAHDDRGGNDERLVNGPPGDPKANLHAFWIRPGARRSTPRRQHRLRRKVRRPTGKHDAQQVRALADELAARPMADPSLLSVSFDHWARESNDSAATSSTRGRSSSGTKPAG
ncbi:MAG: S1/P1 nuclease [Verrucomicrobiota bacterium]